MNPRMTVFDAKRLIGRRYDDSDVKKDMAHWPFKVIDQGGNPVVQVEYLNETKTFTPQEISSMVLMKVMPTNQPRSSNGLPIPETDEGSC